MKALSPSTGDRILDVGAGEGRVAKRVLAESGRVEVYVLEPDEKRVASVRRRIPELKCYVGSSEKMPFESAFFDKAYTTLAAHHFTDLHSALLEFARVLKSGGELVILDVDPSQRAGRLLRFFENTIMRRHFEFLCPDQMNERLLATGRFTVLDSSLGAPGYIVLCVTSA
jgi:ubiquinone/menaquinone biosynthesis C-methylase UbiE